LSELFSDKKTGELRILGQRHVAIDVEALCRHLDTCVGAKVAEVIMNNHENRKGREDTEEFRRENPQAKVPEIVALLAAEDRISGLGITRVNLPAVGSEPVFVEIENPAVTRTEGAAKALAFSYWAGALSLLFGREFEVADVTYDQSTNKLRGRLVPR
jgi:hypothetical protein